MRRLVLIANPVASGFTASLHREVVATLTGPYDVTPLWPNSAVDARRAAAGAAAEGYDVVVAMGGDGVAHQVANGILGTPTALGIVPAGTTNVLARMLGLPAKPARAAGLIADLSGVKEIPVAAVEDDSAAGVRSRLALFNVGIGFDADVVRRAEERPLSKVSFGVLHYALSTARVLLGGYRNKLPDLDVYVDGAAHRGVAVLVQVHDVYSYLGPRAMRLGPGGPGLTIAIAETLPVLRTLRIVGRTLTSRSLDALQGITVVEGTHTVAVSAPEGAHMQADGEHLGTAASATVEIAPSSLRVVAPD